MRLELNRNYFTSYCILGRLVDPQSGRGWDTLEQPYLPSSVPYAWLGSCLPLGEYRVQRYHTEAYPNVYAVSAPSVGVYSREQDAPAAMAGKARSRQVIQPASFAGELRGGIAIGKERAKDGGIWTLTRSRDAMNELRNLIGLAMDVTLAISSGTRQEAAG